MTPPRSIFFGPFVEVLVGHGVSLGFLELFELTQS